MIQLDHVRVVKRLENCVFCAQVDELFSVDNCALLEHFHREESVVVNSADQEHLSEGTSSDARNQLAVRILSGTQRVFLLLVV